jgi:multidrug transporter EmrE-like cation transporter
MNLVSFALILLGVVLNALAQTLLKAGTNRLGPLPSSLGELGPTIVKVMSLWPFLLGFTFYGISLVVWIVALTRVPVTVAYPMLSIGYIINALVARYWLGEHLTFAGWAGIGLICLGVTLIARAALPQG